MNTLVTYNNTGAMHPLLAFLLIFVSVVLAILNLFGYFPAGLLIAAIPAVYVWARWSLFRLLVNAQHFAHHAYEADMMEQEIDAMHTQMRDVVTLDANSFLRNLAHDDEQAGRA